jgi:hypothetical protein
VMRLASNGHRAIAIDLPGVGGSICDGSDGTKRQRANTIQELIVKMRSKGVVLVGQDIGGNGRVFLFAHVRRLSTFRDHGTWSYPVLIHGATSCAIGTSGISPCTMFLNCPRLSYRVGKRFTSIIFTTPCRQYLHE